ncbi:hypothetical protein GCM10023086_47300 [Streptomyces venetus]|uniref:Uncharacterized protein n=1 Tax=Streptomyces venetus TaxID=1701086 RepID=A0ABP8GD61_9ACTN
MRRPFDRPTEEGPPQRRAKTLAVPRFPHQTRTLIAAGLRGIDDLGEAPAGMPCPATHPGAPTSTSPASPLN